MDRRELLKTLTAGACLPDALIERITVGADSAAAVESEWHLWPDMLWVGPEYWANRLHDWRLRKGEVECTVSGHNRTLHSLTTRLGPSRESFTTEVTVRSLGGAVPGSYFGFRLGAKGRFDDYRSAAVYGQGLDAGLTTAGRLFIGDREGSDPVPLDAPVRLRLSARARGGEYEINLEALNG